MRRQALDSDFPLQRINNVMNLILTFHGSLKLSSKQAPSVNLILRGGCLSLLLTNDNCR